ncbi:MAG: alpha/beta fold hydrolase [Rhodospirillaceae bacterium]|nr:alpha/beta fold hydrolase [Rhodospirillaceae bacterium]
MTIQALRTDEARFAHLPGFPFSAHYFDSLPGFEGLRMHYLDENPGGRPGGQYVFLCLHGQPTWSYLYRRMIPIFTAAGHRVVAPDFFGFGRSDKPAAESAYTFDFHRDTLRRFIEALDLKNIVLVCQDWGGVLGLTLPMETPERFAGLFVMDTLLGTGDPPGKPFLDWREYSNRTPDMDVGRLLKRGCPHMSEAEASAYGAPFPDASYKAGVRRFPNLVPTTPGDPGAEISRRARDWLRDTWHGKSFAAIGLKDPVLLPHSMRALVRGIRGCLPPFEVAEAGHFVQEWGEDIARAGLKSLALA